VISPGDKVAAASASPAIAGTPLPPATIKRIAPNPIAKGLVAAPKPPVAPKPSAPTLKPTPSFAAAGGTWRVQLGAYGSAQGARGQWAAMSRKIGALGGLSPVYEPAGTFTRLRAGPLANRAAAERLCAAAKAGGQACFPVAP
jgi:cell division septation protein DedD